MPIDINIAKSIPRRPDRGIVLITTLLLMMLLAGFAIAAQSRALAQIRVLDKLRQVEQTRLLTQSARSLALPLIGEAMLDRREQDEISVTVEDTSFEFTVSKASRRNWYVLSID
jgi:type II secretory pathway component PulK